MEVYQENERPELPLPLTWSKLGMEFLTHFLKSGRFILAKVSNLELLDATPCHERTISLYGVHVAEVLMIESLLVLVGRWTCSTLVLLPVL